MPTIFEVEKPFPGPVPVREGAIMELWQDGLVVLIQMPRCSKEEIESFKQSFSEYAYLETSTPIPIAVWIFNFPKPHGQIDVNFNIRLVKPEYQNNYLDTKNGVKNLLTFYLLDQQILKGIKIVGLDPGAVRLFHDTIKKQVNLSYLQEGYDKYLNLIYLTYSAEELFQMGKKFTK